MCARHGESYVDFEDFLKKLNIVKENINVYKEKIDYKAPPTMNTGGGGNNNPQGIELAKASTTSATILGPAEIQKEAANEIKGPTSVEMSAPSTALTADQILLASKRKGRRTTNMTAKKTLDKNYTLSKKTLLGG